jgi:cytochrome c biogenesis protein CcmG, thiol:disulfide interchange protein DsbE
VGRAVAIGLAAGFAALLVYGIVSKAPDTTIDDALARGTSAPAPPFTLDVLTTGRYPGTAGRVVDRAAGDGRIALRELRGTPLVLNFWASWCTPCETEAPVLRRGTRPAAAGGVLVLGIDQQDFVEPALDFLREYRLTYPNLREGGKTIARSYGATGIPETFFVDATGDVVGHVVGALDDELMRRGIEAARTGRPVVLGTGGARQSAR